MFNIGNGSNRSVNELANMMVGLQYYPRIHRPPVIEPEATLADNFKAWETLEWSPSTKIETWFIKYKKELGI